MAGTPYSSAGVKVYISATLPSTDTQAGYEAVPWTEIDQVTSIGAHGKTYEMATYKVLAKEGTFKLKGGSDEGNIDLQMCRVGNDDPGQTLVKQALDSKLSYSLKVVHPNVKTVSGTVEYMKGKILSYPTSDMSDPNAIVMASVNIAIDGEIIEVAAV